MCKIKNSTRNKHKYATLFRRVGNNVDVVYFLKESKYKITKIKNDCCKVFVKEKRIEKYIGKYNSIPLSSLSILIVNLERCCGLKI